MFANCIHTPGDMRSNETQFQQVITMNYRQVSNECLSHRRHTIPFIYDPLYPPIHNGIQGAWPTNCVVIKLDRAVMEMGHDVTSRPLDTYRQVLPLKCFA